MEANSIESSPERNKDSATRLIVSSFRLSQGSPDLQLELLAQQGWRRSEDVDDIRTLLNDSTGQRGLLDTVQAIALSPAHVHNFDPNGLGETQPDVLARVEVRREINDLREKINNLEYIDPSDIENQLWLMQQFLWRDQRFIKGRPRDNQPNQHYSSVVKHGISSPCYDEDRLESLVTEAASTLFEVAQSGAKGAEYLKAPLWGVVDAHRAYSSKDDDKIRKALPQYATEKM